MSKDRYIIFQFHYPLATELQEEVLKLPPFVFLHGE